MPPVSTPPDAPSLSRNLQNDLRDVFGFDDFRALQHEAIEAAVAGEDVLVVMPTGAGKSLCFQLPAALSEGVTIVVSPLVALMRDQVESLKNRTAFSHLGCAYLNSLQSADEQRYLTEELLAGGLKLLYIAPERFRSPAFLDALRQTKIARFVVDEAHCISEWGHDFRPDYLALKDVIEELGCPPLMAVTATATLRVQDSIVANLGMREPKKFIGGFNRPNLHFSVHRCKSDNERQEKLKRALPKLASRGGSGLVYVSTRRQCEELASLVSMALAPHGFRAAAYHAGLDASTRNAIQNAWLLGEVQVLVATNAFGMGIDKPNVRFVIHWGYPDSLESYYQEAGRAGRDGRKSRCVVLTHFSDRRTREWFIDNDALEADDVKNAHALLVSRVLSNEENNVARVPRGWWKSELDWSEVKARLTLSELERSGLVRRLGETADETILKIERRDFPSEAHSRIRRDLQKQRDERYRRLDEMTGYCKTSQCRRRTMLAYFGDLERPFTGGFCCDNCETTSTQKTPESYAALSPNKRAPMPLRVFSNDIHSLLQAMDALWPQVGKARLNKLLRGANSKDVARFKNEKCPLYGVLRGASEAQIEAFLTKLLDDGVLHQADEDEYFVCRITRAGREAWENKTPLEIAIPGQTQPDEDDWNDADRRLFERLRTWRRDEAKQKNVPPYCVLSDRALMEMAQQKPQSESALLQITGIGTTKIEHYGAALLELLKEEN